MRYSCIDSCVLRRDNYYFRVYLFIGNLLNPASFFLALLDLAQVFLLFTRYSSGYFKLKLE
jgi:hypothetical protein